MYSASDPHVEWNETNSAQESVENDIEENDMTDVHESIQDKVIKILISEHDHLPEEAQEAVEESIRVEPDLWHENADSEAIAKYLASDEADD
jgi:hypothetical protein